MQREIKFRAWDKKQKAFINGFNMIGYSTGQGASKRKLQRFDTYWDEEDVVLMQYTGLKDKNGKEIYEGDVVRFIDGIKINGSTIHQSTVKWVEELSGFYIHAECVGYYQVNPSQCAMYHYEVIGNIYDNPELLQEVSHG